MSLTTPLLIALITLLGVAFIARVRAPRPAPRHDPLARLIVDVVILYDFALLFPLWDFIVAYLGLGLPRLWDRGFGFPIGAAVLLLLPVLVRVLRRTGRVDLGWRLPYHGSLGLAVVVFAILLDGGMALFGAEVPRYDPLTLGLRLLTVSLLEENLFRGAIQGRLEAAMAGEWPWLLSGFLYSLWYLPSLALTLNAADGALAIVPLWAMMLAFGWLLGITRDRTRSLLPCLLANFFLFHTGSLLTLLRP